LTEIFFEEAIVTARNPDPEQRLNPSKPLRPIHNLPISFKDSFKIIGKYSVIGLASFINTPSQQDSALVSLLKSFGAVLYCKTGFPQTMMKVDSYHNFFERTLNPNNIHLTAGGSSGSGGAPIALR
jgi:amidase